MVDLAHTMQNIDVDTIGGLSGTEVLRKLSEEGYNELPSSEKRGVFRMAVEVIKEPIFLLLIGSGSLYFVLGDVTEAMVLLSFVFVIIGITVYQEEKTEKAIDALKNLSSPRALVIRDGDDQPSVYSGTLVIQGQAVAEVKATGIRTEMGKIGVVLGKVARDETKLKREISFMVRNSALIGLCLCAIVIVVYGLTRFDWIHGFLAGITLDIAILPEEFPVVFTVFLALGAWRMSRKNVLTRQAQAIETLGSATVLCVDKTGTLTQNKMSVARLFEI